MIRLFQMYLQYDVFLWLPRLLFGYSKCIYSMVYFFGFPGRVWCFGYSKCIYSMVYFFVFQVEFGDSVIPNVFTVWCISLASHVEIGDSVIPNVFTVWCISLASQVEFVYFFGFAGRV